jgi:peroxiredoxin
LVIVEVMSAYCPYCQREAPAVNRLFRAIQADPDLAGRVKLFGLAADNSYFETELFRDRYEVPFHLLPDPELLVAQMLGEVRTPHFLVLRLEPGGPGKVVLSQRGHLGEVEVFLDQALRAGGLRQEGGGR